MPAVEQQGSFGRSIGGCGGGGGNHDAFYQLIEKTMRVVQRILDRTKNPMMVAAAANVDHQYEDKYALTEFLVNTGIAATLNVLQQLDGFNIDVLKQICVVVQQQHRSMTLRLAVDEDCEYLEETTRTVESPASHQVTVQQEESTTGGGGGSPTATAGSSPGTTPTASTNTTTTTYSHKIVTQVKEYHWKAGIRHKLILFAGTDEENQGMELGTRTGTTRLVTSTNQVPFPPTTTRPPNDLDLTWLINQINPETLESSFTIHRDENCKTPRRNKQTDEAIQFIKALKKWSIKSLHYFCRTIQSEILRCNDYDDLQQTNNTSPSSPQSPPPPPCPAADWISKIDASNVFIPVVPLFQQQNDEIGGGGGGGEVEADGAGDDSTIERVGIVSVRAPASSSSGGVPPILTPKDTSLFLKEQCNSLTRTLLDVAGNFPDQSDQEQLITGYEAKLVLLWHHLRDVAVQWEEGIEYVEQMLYSQLVSAIGKVVTASDFNDYMKFHNQRLLGKSFLPKPFCYAIRQPNQYPDGELSIVAKPNSYAFGGNEGTPIQTFSRHIPGDTLMAPMIIPLNAATNVEFLGDQYLHGWMDTQFASQSPDRFYVSARARQFSCFLLMTGNISGPNEFKPIDAIILQNKDEILIDLLTTSLPSAKEFRDAIKSLSPEQARFAKAYRSMQLDSSVFGVCVIQVKPQMECLLNLPPNALTKEIQLTQDLLSLFVEYQIPPNLVSYDGEDSATLLEKVTAVKNHVKGVLDVIKGVKETQLEEERKKAEMRKEHEIAEFGGRLRTARFGGGGGRAGGGFGGSRFGGSEAVCAAAPSPAPFAPSSALAAAASSSPSPAPFGAPAEAASSSTQTMQPQGAEAVSTNLDMAEGYDVLQDQFSDLIVGEIPTQQNDFTAIPKHLDQMFESFDKDGALRTMTLKTGDQITRTRQQNILMKMGRSKIGGDAKKRETNKALDLLDALSRSGSLPVVSGELHVVVGVRHSFEKNVMATVIEENVNPIEKVDYSSLLIASTVHQVDIPTLLANSAEPPPTLVLKNQQFPPSMNTEAITTSSSD